MRRTVSMLKHKLQEHSPGALLRALLFRPEENAARRSWSVRLLHTSTGAMNGSRSSNVRSLKLQPT